MTKKLALLALALASFACLVALFGQGQKTTSIALTAGACYGYLLAKIANDDDTSAP